MDVNQIARQRHDYPHRSSEISELTWLVDNNAIHSHGQLRKFKP
jgi:hypothetical protein